MDLSGLKWPIIIVVIIGIGWLMTSGGVNFMQGQFTKTAPGTNPERDIKDEAGLSKLGGYLMTIFRYEKAAEVLQIAVDRYGSEGANYYYNQYRIAQCLEELKQYQQAYDKYRSLQDINAAEYDDRVPTVRALANRASSLKELHQLQ